MSKSLVELMVGEVRLESELGKGCKFYSIIPLWIKPKERNISYEKKVSTDKIELPERIGQIEIYKVLQRLGGNSKEKLEQRRKMKNSFDSLIYDKMMQELIVMAAEEDLERKGVLHMDYKHLRVNPFGEISLRETTTL